VDPAEALQLGGKMAEFPGVTHCYRRSTVEGRWDYEIYTVHHSRRREDLCDEVAEIAADTGIEDYLVLFSGEELSDSAITRSVPQVKLVYGDHPVPFPLYTCNPEKLCPTQSILMSSV